MTSSVLYATLAIAGAVLYALPLHDPVRGLVIELGFLGLASWAGFRRVGAAWQVALALSVGAALSMFPITVRSTMAAYYALLFLGALFFILWPVAALARWIARPRS